MAAAGSPATGLGGMYYILLFGISIVLRLYRNNTINFSKSAIVLISIVTVYLIVILSILQAFKIMNLGEILNNLWTSLTLLVS